MELTEAWAVLGLEPDATEDAIRTAFRDKARFVHPDRHPGRDDGVHTELMQRLSDARDVALRSRLPAVEQPASPPMVPPPSVWRDIGRVVGRWRSKR